MKERRGRKKIEYFVKPQQWEDRYMDKDGSDDIWKWDLDKSTKGPIETKVIYPKDYKFVKPKIDNKGKIPITMVFKTSERKNAKYKIKCWTNKNMDQILRMRGIGVPESAIIVELGTGFKFKEEWELKYKKQLK